MNCLWCEAEFAPRRTGGKAQRFCSSECRTAFHSAGHRTAPAGTWEPENIETAP